MTILDALNCPEKAIAGFYHPPTGNFYVTYTRHCFWFYAKQLKMLRDGVHPSAFLQNNAKELVFVIQDNIDGYHGDYVGKEMLNYYPKNTWMYKTAIPVYKRKAIIETYGKVHVKVVACLVDHRYNKTRIKEFNKVKEAEDFLNQHSILDLLKMAYKKQ